MHPTGVCPEMHGKMMIVEVVIFVEGHDGTPARWGLRQVKGVNSWGSCMRFSSTPGAAMYGRPMVCVQFIIVTDDVGCCSDTAHVRLVVTAAASTAPSGNDHLVYDPRY